jgi:TolB-like protein
VAVAPVSRTVLLCALCGCAAVPAVQAQCPDGTPPPCASRRAAAAPAANSVAVLYFDDLSRDSADAFLADGLTEEVIIRLGQVDRLAVKSRFEVQRFRGAPASQDPAALGRSLNTAYLVTGSVQRVGERVRLRVALVRAATRAQVWGDVIDRSSADLLTVESDIAREVTTAITGRLLPAERTRLARAPTADPVAYQEYLRGIALKGSMDEASLRAALVHFDRALARDSSFAAAYAGETYVWFWLADAYEAPREALRRAAVAAQRALALDSTLSEASAIHAWAAFLLDLDGGAAERRLRRALAADPRNAMAHSILSIVLSGSGRAAEGVGEAERAWVLDSLNNAMSTMFEDVLVFSHRLDSLAVMLPRLRAVVPRADADMMEGRMRASRGDLRGAEPFLDWRYYGGWVAGWYVRARLARGDTVGARATLDSMLARRQVGYYNPIAIARAYVAFGDLDRGMEWLQRAFEERTGWIAWVRVDDELAPLRADPRYAALDRLIRY